LSVSVHFSKHSCLRNCYEIYRDAETTAAAYAANIERIMKGVRLLKYVTVVPSLHTRNNLLL